LRIHESFFGRIHFGLLDAVALCGGQALVPEVNSNRVHSSVGWSSAFNHPERQTIKLDFQRNKNAVTHL
jgi:hypothetical protein